MAAGSETQPPRCSHDDSRDVAQPHQQPESHPEPPENKTAEGQDGSDKDFKPKKPAKAPTGGFDPTPLPDAPQGFTLRFVFHSAKNLAAADFRTASSDPFLTATLRAANPRRHKEEPDLVHRTPTLRRTLEPEWNDEWIVANVPPSGFSLKCRLYDEDYPDGNDRLGNVTVKVAGVYEGWEGIPRPGKEFEAKKHVMSKRALVFRGLTKVVNHHIHMTPLLTLSIEYVGLSDPPFAQMYTLGPTNYIKHFSPMIGRLVGTKVNADEHDDQAGGSQQDEPDDKLKGKGKHKSQKYDFQANEMQLQGPVPVKLYHRYVAFRPIITSMFASVGLRGKILNAALHKQHQRIYNFDSSTEYGSFQACSKEAALEFLRLVHFDQGSRTFTYVLTLDARLLFTETGKEFSVDLLSKHSMHSNVAPYIACSGEFFVRRLEQPNASDDPDPHQKTHPSEDIAGGPPHQDPPPNPAYYQLIIDNDSGTYRPDKSVLPELKMFLSKNFPGLGIVAMHWEDEELQKLKERQRTTKKKEGRVMNVVMNSSQSSISSAESKLDKRDKDWELGRLSKREAALAAMEDPSKLKQVVGNFIPGQKPGESSKS
ncbi:hypothetical protein CDD82_3544 [Ophiocordyceps australis]|uniref:C2 domain-containing protein n=1 Tax=Ophiocordyceps australis TaxID=1399860 RepID=A0A2C5ZBJ6_9HYPO|nr:hypothetical protein CDD82_3544 [Ophiocordyceps australis]